MGFKSRVKKATKTVKKSTILVTKKATVAQKKVQKVANTPIVKTAVTAVATTLAGPAGGQAVNTGYAVLNSEMSTSDLLIGSVCPDYLITKAEINQFKGQSAQTIQTKFKYQSSPLSTLIPASSNVGNFADKSISYSGITKGLLQKANGINNAVKSAQGKRKGLIAEILSWFGF